MNLAKKAPANFKCTKSKEDVFV